jgi:glutamate dehydrogenase
VLALVPTLDISELAAAAGLPVEEAARVYLAIGERLDLRALSDRIAALPREERWEALARRALQEDLAREQRSLTAEVLATAPELPAAQRLDAWLAANAAAVERCAQMLGDVKAGSTYDLATLSVAVREIANLIQATAVRSL